MTVPDLAPDAVGDTERPDEPEWPKRLRWVLILVIGLPYIWGLLGLELSWGALGRAPGQIWGLMGGLLPPDWSDIAESFNKLLESIYVAWIASIIGAFFSFPLGFMAATNMAPNWMTGPVRALLSGIRAFPELVLAIVLIPAFGLGPFTGVLAIGIHSIGTLGKLTSEVIEGVDPGPIEAIKATGGTRFQAMRFGVVPQAMPNILAYWLYRFEINIRASAVLGMIGAGGIGAEIVGRLRFRDDWPKAGAALIITIVVVLIIDAISAGIRRRIIAGHPGTGPVSRTLGTIVGDVAPPVIEIQEA